MTPLGLEVNKIMASSTIAASTVGTMGPAVVGKAPVVVVWGKGGDRPRQLAPEAEIALQKLSHAIEYLAGDCIYEGESFNLSDPRVQAVLLLLERNREIYFTCPPVPSLSERLRAWLGLKAA